MDDELDIGEVVRATGLAPSALRFYERKGVIAPVGRNGLRRTYDPGVVDRLALVRALAEAGFTIGEVARLVDDPVDADVRAALVAKADDIDARIGRLAATRDRLRRAAACPSPALLDCPHVLPAARGLLPARGRSATAPTD